MSFSMRKQVNSRICDGVNNEEENFKMNNYPFPEATRTWNFGEYQQELHHIKQKQYPSIKHQLKFQESGICHPNNECILLDLFTLLEFYPRFNEEPMDWCKFKIIKLTNFKLKMMYKNSDKNFQIEIEIKHSKRKLLFGEDFQISITYVDISNGFHISVTPLCSLYQSYFVNKEKRYSRTYHSVNNNASFLCPEFYSWCNMNVEFKQIFS